MPSKPVARESREHRVPLKVTIDARGISEPLPCEGETIVVNLHGALISPSAFLKVGTIIEIQVDLTGKRAQALVCFVDPTASSTVESHGDAAKYLGSILAAGRLAARAIQRVLPSLGDEAVVENRRLPNYSFGVNLLIFF